MIRADRTVGRAVQHAGRRGRAAPAALADWDTSGTVTASLPFQAGVNLLTVARTGSDTGAINLNYLGVGSGT